MDSQVVTIDQFATAMASIQEVITSLSQRMDGQQAKQVLVQESVRYDPTIQSLLPSSQTDPQDTQIPPLSPLGQTVPLPTPFTLQSQTEVAPLPTMVVVPTSEDAHACMDKLEQRMRQMRISNGGMVWDDFNGLPVVSLSAKFRMLEIERYTGIGCPRIHLRLYSIVMRAHGLDETQMIMLFPMSLSGATLRWFASLDVSRHRTWDDLAREFLRQFAFNTVIDVSRKELEALEQRPNETVTSFISHLREKNAQIIDRSFERDHINMIIRSLQPRFSRHLMGFPHADFGSLVQALYGIKEGIAKGLWPDSFPSNSKRKKPAIGQRPRDISAISATKSRPLRYYQTIGQTSGVYYPSSPHMQYKPPVPFRPMSPAYLLPAPQPVYATQATQRPPTHYPQSRFPPTQRQMLQFSQLGMPLSRAFQKLANEGLSTISFLQFPR